MFHNTAKRQPDRYNEYALVCHGYAAYEPFIEPPRHVRHHYGKNFGIECKNVEIESSYRLSEQLRISSTTRNPVDRGAWPSSQNVWQSLHWVFASTPQRDDLQLRLRAIRRGYPDDHPPPARCSRSTRPPRRINRLRMDSTAELIETAHFTTGETVTAQLGKPLIRLYRRRSCFRSGVETRRTRLRNHQTPQTQSRREAL